MNTAKIDLHVHLDGSLDLLWQWETAIKRKVVSCSFEEYKQMMYRRDYPSREERMKRFDLPVAVMQTREDLFMSIYGLVERLAKLGLVYAEIRFAPQQHQLLQLTQREVVQAVLDGMHKANQDFPSIRTGLICCLMHKGNSAKCNHEANLETIEVAKEFLHKGVVGLDLAGYENNCPFTEYAYLFEIASEYKIPYTIHAGEMGEGIHVMEAIHMGATRLGHGVNCMQNEAWLQEVINKQIPLEVCVSSNVYDSQDYLGHPIRELLKMNVKVTINSDNMTFLNTDLVKEHEILRSIGVSEEDLMKCMYHAVDAAFCDEETKHWILKQIETC